MRGNMVATIGEEEAALEEKKKEEIKKNNKIFSFLFCDLKNKINATCQSSIEPIHVTKLNLYK